MRAKVDYKDFCVTPETPIRTVIQRIDRTRHGIALVANSDHCLIGTVTDGDIRRAVLANVDLNGPVSIILDRKKGTLYDKPTTAPFGLAPDAYLAILK